MKHCFYKFAFCLFTAFCFFNSAQAQTTATIHANNTVCALNNGSAQVYPTGGSGYTYHWSNNGSLTDTISNLSPGNYSVTVYGTPISDSVVKTFSIAASTAPSISISATRDTICLGSSDELRATGAAPGGYIWSGGTLVGTVNADSINVSTLNAGNYTYTVTWGPTGCTSQATFTLTSGPVTANLFSIIQPSCGRNNGTINCSTSSFNSVNTFLLGSAVLQHGGGTQLVNVGPGTYTFVVSDITTGCSDTLKNITLVDTSSIPVFSNIVVNPEKCFGDKKGAIFVTVGNCSSGCTYSWSQNPSDHTDSAVNLPAGLDTFYVSKGGCTNIDTIINVPGPSAALKDSLRIHSDHCGRSIGSAMIMTTGGTAPFSYVWSMGTSLGDSVKQVTGDSILSVTVTDANGCLDSLKKFIPTTAKPTAKLNKPDTICSSESNGILIATPTSGAGPFSYHWSNGQTSNVAAGLPHGTYTVTVSDGVGCDTVLTGVVPDYQPLLSVDVIPSYNLYLGQNVEISLQTNVPVKNVVWTPYIPGSTGSSLVTDKPDTSTVYTVILTYGQSCKIYDTIFVNVINDTASKFNIPNTFTPNGDGINDNFKLITYPALASFHIWIFDRWGNKVYESTDTDFNWNGLNQYAGDAILNTGVFSYVVEYQPYSADSKKTIGGNISLVK
jgi:gliding motility-associated-like protein